jgi:peptidoglycan/LPS O-acetylase OafA/YrhL
MVFAIHVLQPFDPVAPTGPINPFADQGLTSVLLRIFGPAGFLGVSFFFLLSGFVLTWAARSGDRATAFWRRRFVKIFPSHVASWALIMIFFGGAISLSTWLPNLLLVHSFLPIPAVQLGVNPPSWSLCAELLFYLCFPLILVGVRRISQRHLWWWTAAMVAGIAAVAVVTLTLIPDTPRSPLVPLSFPQMWFGYTFPGTRLFEFALGMLLARIVMAGLWPRIKAGPVVALLVAGYLAAMYAPAPFNFSLAMAIPFGVLICASATADIHDVPSFLRSRSMVWLGKVSFNFYLAQGLVLFWARPAVLGTATYSVPVALLVVVAMFAATLAVGWLVHVCVEVPAMKRWSRSGKRQRASVAPISAPPAAAPVAASEAAVGATPAPSGGAAV